MPCYYIEKFVDPNYVKFRIYFHIANKIILYEEFDDEKEALKKCTKLNAAIHATTLNTPEIAKMFALTMRRFLQCHGDYDADGNKQIIFANSSPFDSITPEGFWDEEK